MTKKRKQKEKMVVDLHPTSPTRALAHSACQFARQERVPCGARTYDIDLNNHAAYYYWTIGDTPVLS